jgi:hypothetical protein
MTAFFLEPTRPDPRPGLRGESTWEFLHRSTWRRAAEIRAFYNEALAALPPESHRPILDALRSGRTEPALLELVVGRFLQLRGATGLEHEPEYSGRRVDWRATFPDGVVHVEAFVPLFNAVSGEARMRQDRLLDVLEPLIPAGWWVIPFHLPTLPGDAPIRPFRTVAQNLLSQLPPAATVERGVVVELAGRVPEGRVELAATRATTRGGLGGGSMITYLDNSDLVLRRAWRNERKRKQGRSAPPPALLAIAGSFLGADVEDFEVSLFGRDVRHGRKPDGAMATDRNPPWAGVLAFPMVSPAGAADPVLFLAPSYSGPSLPVALGRLEVRRLTSNGVSVTGARDHNVLDGVRWAAP